MNNNLISRSSYLLGRNHARFYFKNFISQEIVLKFATRMKWIEREDCSLLKAYINEVKANFMCVVTSFLCRTLVRIPHVKPTGTRFCLKTVSCVSSFVPQRNESTIFFFHTFKRTFLWSRSIWCERDKDS